MRTLIALAVGVATFSCAPVLHLRRATPPQATLGSVRTLSVDVTTDVPRAVENAVVTGLVLGELPVPVPVDTVVHERLVARLQQLGYVVCPAAPCGDGAMTVRMTESAVGTELTGSGPRAHSRLAARVVVKQHDGREPYDFSFWDRRTGRVSEAPLLVRASADAIAASFASTLLPGTAKSKLPLEDGGPLTPGVNMLLSSNWTDAIGYFTVLTQQQPELAGAWYDLGVAHEAAGNWPQALSAYEQAAARQRKGLYLDAVAAARRMAPVQQPTVAPPPQPIPAP